MHGSLGGPHDHVPEFLGSFDAKVLPFPRSNYQKPSQASSLVHFSLRDLRTDLLLNHKGSNFREAEPKVPRSIMQAEALVRRAA